MYKCHFCHLFRMCQVRKNALRNHWQHQHDFLFFLDHTKKVTFTHLHVPIFHPLLGNGTKRYMSRRILIILAKNIFAVQVYYTFIENQESDKAFK